MSFYELNLKSEYHSLDDNMAKDFYIPLLSNAKTYKRAVGYFSSSILVKISSGIVKMANNNGKIQIIASPYLSDDDVNAINLGYEKREQVIINSLDRELRSHDNENERNRLNLLANLIADGFLDIKIAYTDKHGSMGLFHDKFGVIIDEYDNKVAFSGSMNESLNGIMYNSESIDVYTSWSGGDSLERIDNKESRFDNIWNASDSNVKILDFVDVNEKIIKKYKTSNYDYSIDIDELAPLEVENVELDEKENLEINIPKIPEFIKLYDYQKNAIENWENHNFIGIYDMATGTGKTLTALGSLAYLFDKVKRLAVVICCPYQHLVEQWVEDILKFNIEPIVAYAGKNYKRRLQDAVFNYNIGASDFFCLICTNGTYSRNYVQSMIEELSGETLIIVDEAHNFGAQQLSKMLNPKFSYRLALSATLDRHGDVIGTRALYDYFGDKCIEYSLEDAIREGKLTPYKYIPVEVNLTAEELEKYNKLSDIISKHIIEKPNGQKELDQFGKIKAQERSRLVAGAYNKAVVLFDLMKDKKDESNMLVYCGATKITEDYSENEDIRQIDYISRMLGNDLNMNVAQFTANENSEQREQRIKAFTDGDVQALIAIKCLDEGVNIPKIKTAFILASTTNPKEYIQRRGRVLRKAPGKDFAVIYDFITLPRPKGDVKNMTVSDISKDKGLILKEITRMQEFKAQAMNPMLANSLIDELMELYDLYSYTDTENYIIGDVEDE